MITNYTTLQSAITDWLQRPDLTSVAPQLIQMGESRLRRDERIKRLVSTTLTVDGPSEALPSGFKEVESIWHAGPTVFGELRTVSEGEFALVKRQEPTAGPPRVVAFVDQSAALFAPQPDQEYELRFSYWSTVPRLSSGSPTNWLIERDPDIYLYAALVESAPYLRDDERIALWEASLQARIEEFHQNRTRGEFSGRLSMRPAHPIP
jgi:hypothetical protein